MAGKLALTFVAFALLAPTLSAQESLGDIARRNRVEKNSVSTSTTANQPEHLAATFAEAAAVADRQETAAETKDYFSTALMPAFGATFGPSLQTCFAGMKSPDADGFAFVAAIGSDGRVTRLYHDRETNISRCALGPLQKAAFPQPPVHPYYLHIDMHFPKGEEQESDDRQRLPLVLFDKYSYTFGLPASWNYDFEQAKERGALLAFFPQGGTFSGSKNVIYISEENAPCVTNCKGHLQDAIKQLLKEAREESPQVRIIFAESIKTADGSTAEIRILDGSKDPRASTNTKDKEALAVIEHQEAIVLVILTATDVTTWDRDYKAFQEIVRGHKFFNCDSPNLARPCK